MSARSQSVRPPAAGARDVLRLAWPAMLSYVLGNSYRINDQFWIQRLGGDAQAAIGASMFVLIMNFALTFLAVGGTLAVVARATGAGNRELRDRAIRSALALGVLIAALLTAAGPALTPAIVATVGLSGEAAALAREYLGTLYLLMLPMVLVPILDHALIGMGRTRVPMVMQLVSLSLNFLLNPLLIYGAEAARQAPHPCVRPVAELAASLASAAGLDHGLGMTGAVIATAVSRAAAVLLGLAVLVKRHHVRLARPFWSSLIARDILTVSAPISASIALYAGVYWILLDAVMAPLGAPVIAGLGIGFQVFEGLAFPCFLGVAQATASLVGQALGARAPRAAVTAVGNAYRIGLALGLIMALAFVVGGPLLVPLFTEDGAVEHEALVYVRVLAFSQLFVAFESINEKVLTGSGMTRPALLISASGNLLRVPLAWLLAHRIDLGAAGVWWAINLTTLAKATALGLVVRRRRWLRHRLRSA